MAAPSWQDRLDGWKTPAILLYFAVRCETLSELIAGSSCSFRVIADRKNDTAYISVAIETITQRTRPLKLESIRDEAFSRFWNIISGPPDPNQPLMGSAALIPPLLAKSRGVVLELGPGNGSQVRYFAPATAAITRIYGAEPCIPLHKGLRAQADEFGLERIYAIVPAGAESKLLVPALRQVGLIGDLKNGIEVFDTIVCVRVLCSVSNLEETVEHVYDLLKPGGQLLVCEHVVNPWNTSKGSLFARVLQKIYTLLGWTYFVGNCHLERDIRKALVDLGNKKGGWDDVELTNCFWWSALPYVTGTLVKKKKQ